MTGINPVKLLILEGSQNRAEELIVLLRTAGRATRAHLLASAADLQHKLNTQNWDLCLAKQEVNGLTIEYLISQVKSLDKDIPVIMLAEDRDPATITAGLKLGALDVALDDDDERLMLIIDRELGNLDNRRSMRLAEVQLRETDRRNQLLLDSSNAAIAYVHEGMHIYTNAAYGELFGYEDPDDFAGIPVIDLISAEDQEKFKTCLRDFASNPVAEETFTCIASDDSRIIANLSLLPATYDGEPCTQMIFRTTTDSSELEDRIRQISSQDFLTGLYNRAYFIEQLELAVDQAINGQSGFALLYICLDDFTRVRVAAGISGADLVLGEIAHLMRENVDSQHIMARFGDEEFTLLVKGVDNEAAAALAETIRAVVEDHLPEASNQSFQITTSIGLAMIGENTPSAEEVIARAHKAAASHEHSNAVNFYQIEQAAVGEQGRTLTRETITRLVRKAVAGTGFRLLFQPILSLHGEDDELFEVLLRLLDEDANELPPVQFLGAAQDAGLLEKLDRWVILQSIKMLSAKRAEGSKSRLFINVTHASMTDSSFLPWITVALQAARLPSDAIIFQLDEKQATAHIKDAAKFSEGLAKLHFKTSINHFGCSLNPFNLLKHLKPDYVKLDGSFAQQVEGSKEKQEDLIDMVKSLQSTGVLTAISGVESPAVLSTLWQAGVNFIQGYYISMPLESLDYDFTNEDL
ncbi:MAG: EAL domain-containing protein [SAR86 cluster bacterium]|jgi:multidomain signaling protein FimX|tara:strand:- start:27201 stop:29282 length:2082 start_codon:yes stop_codon:yes gene_type:complete